MTQPVPLFQVIAKEIKVVGSFRYGPGDFTFAIALVARSVVNLRPLVTQRYSFERASEAFDTTRAGRDLAGNVGWALCRYAVSCSSLACYQMYHQRTGIVLSVTIASNA
jgi:hypothetical protein